ncbi:hypothetical protein CsSME_00007726 [Camellia sinensis var. sinensis]
MKHLLLLCKCTDDSESKLFCPIHPMSSRGAGWVQKLQPSSMGMAANLVKKALGVSGAQPDNEVGNKVFKARSASGWIQKPVYDLEGEWESHY